MLNGLITRARWVRLPHPLRSGSSVLVEHRLDTAEVRRFDPVPEHHGLFDYGLGPGVFTPRERVRVPQRLPFRCRPTGRAPGC